MKLRSSDLDQGIRIVVHGAIDGSKCNCLASFWNLHVTDDHRMVEMDLTEVDDIDPLGIATLVPLIRQALCRGAKVILCEPPQMLAHTLYKTADLQQQQLVIVNAREEEPYAG